MGEDNNEDLKVIKTTVEYTGKEFFDLFENDIDHPDNIAENGVLKNTVYNYISTTLLNGFVNYIDIKSVIMIESYTVFDEAKLTNFIKWLKNEFHTDYNKYMNDDVVDDIILFGETENNYWFLWSDRDCSDSNIGRIDKNKVKDIDEFKNSFIYFAINYGYKRYIELPLPSGWITL